MNRMATILTVGALFSTAAFAQNTAATVQRDVNQEQRIENGLKNGSLTTHEASQLEREESRIDRQQAQALKNGSLSSAEKARLAREQNQVSRDITRDTHNGATGNPNSASSKRMQADVQRNINQEKRIEQGVQSGSLTNKEAGHLEAREAHVDHMEAKAGANGHVSAGEQHRIQAADNRDSARIYRQKHDAQTR
jgi:hypothetical protein